MRPALLIAVSVAVYVHVVSLVACAKLGEPCQGDSGAECDSGNLGLVCLQRDGKAPVFKGAGFCSRRVNEGETCDASKSLFCQDSVQLGDRDPSGQALSVPLLCGSAGRCVRNLVGEKGAFCAKETGVVCGGDDQGDECEGALSCEWVTGYPSAAFHCVTNDIQVGGNCFTGIGTPVNVKVFDKCVKGASCQYRGRFSPGVCVEENN